MTRLPRSVGVITNLQIVPIPGHAGRTSAMVLV